MSASSLLLKNPCSGIESPFFWPVGLALNMNDDVLRRAEEHLRFFQQLDDDILSPATCEWATPNKVMYSLRTFALRDFSTSYAKNEIPTLVIPPLTGHLPSLADFRPDQSLIETLLQNGLTRVFCTDWHSATEDMKDFDIDTYLAEMHVAICDMGGRINMVGLCQGGCLASLYAARYPFQVSSLVCAGSPLDTHANNGTVRDLANALPISFYENLVCAGNGLLQGKFMRDGLKGMGPEQHLMNKYLSLDDRIDDPHHLSRTQAFEKWYERTLDLSGRFYLQIIQQLFKENRFARGEFVALGQNITPQTIACPLYLLAGTTDDITPKDQVFSAANLFGTSTSRIVKETVSSGHLGLFMGSRTLKNNWPHIAAWISMQPS